MTAERRRLAVVTIVTVTVAAAVAAVAVMAPWHSALEAERRTLTGIVADRLALIEAIQARTGDPEATLQVLRDAHHLVEGLGDTGELVIARREGDEIAFLVQPRHAAQRTLRLPVGDGKALPMQRALAGEAGTTTGPDYRGATVVAAYRQAPELGWGVVAKMDLVELRRPYARAGAIAAAVIGAATLLGLILVRRELDRGITLLESSERRFRGTFEQAAVGIAHVSPEGRFLRLNRRFCDLVGYPEAELQQLTFQDITHPEDLETDVAQVGRVLAREIDTYTLEKRYLHREGRLVWVNLTVSLIRRPDGRPEHFIAVVEDITERRARQAELVERMKELRCVYELSSLLGDSARPLGAALAEVPGLLSSSWQHTDVTAARVVLGDEVHATPTFRKTPWMQRTEILVDGVAEGALEVALLEERPEADEGPFLAEERALLEEVARRLGAETSRRRSEQALHASERRFRGTFETVPVSIWEEDWSEVAALVDRLRRRGVRDFEAFLAAHPEVVDEALRGVRIRDVNPATLQMFEAADKADLLRSLETVFSTPDTLPGFVGELVALASGQRVYRTEMALRTVAGRLIHTLLTMRFPGPDDSSGTVLVSLMDVSAEHALREQLEGLNTELEDRVEARTRDLAERQAQVERHLAIVDGINTVLSQALTSESDAEVARTCLGIAQEVTGSRFGFIGELNEEGRLDTYAISDPGWDACRVPRSEAVRLIQDMEVRGIWAEVFRTGAAVVVNRPGEHPDRVGTPPGHPELTAFLGAPLRRSDEVVGIIALGNKPGGYTSADRAAIEMLSTAFAEAIERVRAEALVRRLNAELRDSVELLEAANTELESFSYTVSHDLRAPLRAIDGFSRILMTEHHESLEPEARRFLGLVRDNAQTMGRLIDDLLAFSRLSRHHLRTLPTPLGELVDEAWAALAPEREGRAVELEVDELPTLEVDPGLMKLVLVNLLGNALKFTRPRSPARIEIGCTGDGNGSACYVRDNGVGFDMRYADKLFGVFQRLHRAADFEGTGVGLATVQRILHRHGGRVWAEAEPDRGATFFFTLHGGDHGDHQPG